MTEQTEGTTAPVTTTEAAPTVATSATVTAPTPVATQPPAGPPPSTNPDIYDGDGKKWKDRFHGLSGSLAQLRQQADAEKAQLQATIDQLKAQLQQGEQQSVASQTRIADLEAQAGLIPTLNDQITKLQTAQVQRDKLAIMMEYPQLLGLSVTETVTNEDGTEQEKTHNPILRLIESSTLEGEALRRQIEDLAKLHRASPAPVPQQGFNSPTTPAPAAPVAETPDAWRTKAMELQQKMIADQNYSPQAREALADAWRKVRELEAQS